MRQYYIWDLSTDTYDFSYKNKYMKNYKLSEKDEKMLLTKYINYYMNVYLHIAKIIHKST